MKIKKKLSNISLSIGLSALSMGILLESNFLTKVGATIVLLVEFYYFLNMLNKRKYNGKKK